MKLPLSWIKEVIDLNMPPRHVAKLLTHAGLEVDSFSSIPLGFENVVVGEVLQAEKHPGADHLKLATVSDGTAVFQVVCGASNCRKGLKTAFAKVDAVLTDSEGKSFKIKKTKIRGIESFGMLCSEIELGLGDDAEGIMEFAGHIQPGADLAGMYGDIIFDISLTPNLGHCASLTGVARELYAATGIPVRLPEVRVKEDKARPASAEAEVEVQANENCPRYACRLIKDVKIGPSPAWLKKRLIACGFNPINNVVDITNYVLLEMGQPLHAFDYDRLEGGKIIVRKGFEGHVFKALDGKEHALASEDLLICDQNKPVALAGVMGGANSEVGIGTQNILLESAYFMPSGIRKTGKRLGISTEASRRFERGSDPNNVIKALDRAAMLLHDIAGGTVCSGIIEAREKEFPLKEVACRLKRIHQILGAPLSVSEVEAVFQRLEMQYAWDGQDLYTVKVPTYRADIHDEIDLIEEVVRIYGFENIVKKPPRFTSSTLPHSPIYLFENEMRKRLVAEGLQEFITCDLIGPSLLGIVKDTLMPEESSVRVLNPTSIEQSVLRTSLLPGLLQVAKYNYDHDVHDVNGFEIGRIHFTQEEGYKEQSVAGVILTGKAEPGHWSSDQPENDFFHLKGIIENLLGELHISSFAFKNNQLTIFHPGRQASLYIDSLEIGSLGEVHPSIIRRLDLPKKVYFAEIDLHNLFKMQKKELKLQELSIFPGSSRDLTLTLDEEVPIRAIFDFILAIPSQLLEKKTFKLIDLYTGEKAAPGKKNATFRFVYRDKKKTISQEAVDAEHSRIISQIEKYLGGK